MEIYIGAVQVARMWPLRKQLHKHKPSFLYAVTSGTASSKTNFCGGCFRKVEQVEQVGALNMYDLTLSVRSSGLLSAAGLS